MIHATLRTRTTSDWLIASSRGAGEADLRPVVDVDDLPMIPGRSLRGLLRQACLDASAVLGSDAAGALFGDLGRDGRVGIGDARLPAEYSDAISRGEFEPEDLITIRRRTAIDATSGTARPGSLHAIAPAIAGLVLEAPIEVESEEDLARLAFAASMVRRLGMARSRGLGGCMLDVLHEGRVVNGDACTPVGGCA